MTIIRPTNDHELDDRVAEIYASDIDDQGFVAAHTRIMTINIDAYDAWENLIGAIAASMGKRRYELVTLAAALGARSTHCRLAHGKKTLSIVDEGDLVAIARDYRSAPSLSAAEITMMEFAEKVSSDASSMTDDDSSRLRGAGFTDREIVDIALAAAARNYYSRAIQALAVPVDEIDLSDELQAALLAPLNR
ncbi:carboxymuconolactone decarboxylase family protein [Agromyces atrinae]|uniref:Carboxymuconolactone decarboxylase family protein n=1 Tax=Agromyces atrinae TaxID=592376 RepID=A0A4Q2M1Y5_9MICO|nr:carboxymuconolactone decarboxylase family protein [Agromyces atrinae]NYD65511.1 putative peroxidase-related enzyme [Agromyces atrinae]RXZ85759.1 carboxymuconolactone decarboxylase family protein [Agromyces atrinae]